MGCRTTLTVKKKKKLQFQVTLGTSSSQIVLALGKSYFAILMISLTEDLPNPLSIGQVRMKVTCMEKELACSGQVDDTFF